jgi:hypothetical protein
MTTMQVLEAAPPCLPTNLWADWRALTTGPDDPPTFDLEMLSGVPTLARRWLSHSIALGTPLRQAAVFAQHGQIKVGSWRDFEADWALAPLDGFIWAARTHLGPLSVAGFDRYTGGIGEMRWRLAGVAPFIGARGPDVSRSAAGRLAAEFCFVPAVALSSAVQWEEIDNHRVAAELSGPGWSHRVTLTVGRSGALYRVDVQRWGNPDHKPFREHQFTALFHSGEVSFDGFTIPARGYAGWWDCPDGCADESFFRFTIDQARYV